MFRKSAPVATIIFASIFCLEVLQSVLLPAGTQAAIVLAQEASGKLAVPPVEIQTECLAAIHKEFAGDLAKGAPADRVALAKSLISASQKKVAPKDSGERYCLCRAGLSIAVECCEADLASTALNQLNDSFDIDFWKLVVESTQGLRKAADTDTQRESLKNVINTFTDRAVSEDQFETAKVLVGRSVALLSALGDQGKEEKEKLVQFKKDISLMSSLSKAAEKAKVKLAAKPDDARANLDLGNYLILVKLDFENGLVHWKKSSDSKYRDMANLELKVLPANSKDVFALAEAWNQFGEQARGLRKGRFKSRAYHWYQLSVKDLDGDQKTKAKSQMSSLASTLKIRPVGAGEGVARDQDAELAAAPEVDPVLAKSIDAALNWIVSHQLPDGGWSFDHTLGPGDFRQTLGAGELKQARFGATALALLPLIKAGNTTNDGKYKAAVLGGFNFLTQGGKLVGGTLSYAEQGGTMYSHAIVTRAYCDLYQKTKNRDHGRFAQLTSSFIQQAQDPRGGGWRYQPQQPGDTSVLGWQLAALESAQLGGLAVSEETAGLVSRFLDSVSSDDGLSYGYTERPRNAAVNSRMAIGMLARMQLGRRGDDPFSLEGARRLLDKGPGGDVYYTYYGTQAMRRVGGKDWASWKEKVHKLLLGSQRPQPNELGSWWFPNRKDHTTVQGGRLMVTVLSLLTLME